MCLVIRPPVFAQEWSVIPDAVATVDYSTNPLFQISGAEAAMSVVGTVGAELKRETPDTSASIRPRFRTYQSSRNDAGLDRDDQFLSADYNAENEYQRWSISGDYSRESTLTSDLEATGLVHGNARRKNWSMTPSLSMDVMENLSMRLSGSYLSSDYKAPPEAGLIDYINRSVDASIEGVASETLTWSLGVYQSILGVDQVNLTTVTQGVQGSTAWYLNENLDLSLNVGTRRSRHDYETVFGVFETKDRGWLMSWNLQQRWDRNTLNLELSRSVDPSSNGTLQQRDRASLNVDHALTEKTTLLGSAQMSRFNYLDSSTESIDRYYRRIDGRIHWQWSRALALDMTVSYDWRGEQYTDDKARRTVLSFNVSWRDEESWL